MTVPMILSFRPIQLLLVVLVIGALLLAFRIFRNKLFYRLAFLTFLLIGLVLVINPDLTAYLANAVGVGRGVDMIFYMLFTGYVFVTIIIYRRLLRQDEVITMLVRDNAIRNAQKNLESSAATSPKTSNPSQPIS
ncbi:hypothetical protein GCM10027592_45100 [Spirosoma flavus]